MLDGANVDCNMQWFQNIWQYFVAIVTSPKKLRNKLRREHVKPDVKAGFHIIVTIAENVCEDAEKRILKLLTHRLQVFLVKDQYL